MRRELIKAYPDNTSFHAVVWALRGSALHQLYSDLVMHNAKLIQTVEEWNGIPEQMGWNAPNFCR